MPTVLHEVIIDLFRQRPRLAADLLALVLDTPLPEFDHARLESGDFPDIDPTEYRADAVVVLANGTDPALAVIIEVQLRPDGNKSWSWPVYLTTLRARLRCPTMLLVMCPSERTAARCRRPILIAPGCALAPVALGPADVPVVTDASTAATNPELAVLSAIAHRHHPERDAILTTLAENMVDVANGDMYIDLVMAVLPKAARHFLESLMTTGIYEYKSEFARRYYSRGEAAALLRILRTRGFTLSEATTSRIAECTDLDQINTWIDRAVTVDSLDEILADHPKP
ncbi:hypothetical protein OHA40_21435 [Nocardia sp. NBC_00508]|uniref:hypothetical protein n=1 Tax=Nocardia sp. NBC_00508 TaxID=2975992 RepID=UPI002E81F7BA|nr:hypothetical protein [Nocardia sp. NBC_00508]WUD64263.1 hypothetical protein OHA40_21435 [Nocardia sp. NBC_00508]